MTDGQRDGRTNGRTDRQTHRQICIKTMERWTDRRTDRWTEINMFVNQGKTDGRTDRHEENGLTDTQRNVHTNIYIERQRLVAMASIKFVYSWCEKVPFKSIALSKHYTQTD